MARIISPIQFVGPLGDVTAYKMRGVEHIVLRKKGGASRAQIKHAPAFANVRKVNAEFGGRATASKWIMKMLLPQKSLADYNIAGYLNALLKPVQELDTTSVWGQRNIQLSKNYSWLAGFSLNRQTSIDAVLRSPVSFSLVRDQHQAQVVIPALWPQVNFFPLRYPYYQIVLVLGIVPDIIFNKSTYQPSSAQYNHIAPLQVETPWHATAVQSHEQTLTLALNFIPPDTNYTVMLSMGIRYGSVVGPDVIQPVKHAGCAKILALA